MLKRINAINVLGGISIMSLIGCAGFVEENIPAAVICLVIFAGTAYLAMKEDGKRK